MLLNFINSSNYKFLANEIRPIQNQSNLKATPLGLKLTVKIWDNVCQIYKDINLPRYKIRDDLI